MSSGSRHVSGELVRAYGGQHDAAEREVIAHGVRALALMAQVRELAASDRGVLICGETGTGKTMIASALHAHSAAAEQPLRVINCAALSDALLADVLAEFEEDQREPRTILLDEIGELSPWAQAVLLRRLQRATRQRCIRLIAATHRPLDGMVAQGTFSRELLWRLNMARITLLPLRERRDEIAPLSLHFLRLALHSRKASYVSIQPEMLQVVEQYDWPGNVRELKGAMFHTLTVNDSGTLGPEDLPDAVRTSAISVLR